jgi:hypothetical protein
MDNPIKTSWIENIPRQIKVMYRVMGGMDLKPSIMNLSPRFTLRKLMN